MADARPCTHSELIGRVVALESNLAALRQVLDERDERYKLRATSQDAAVKTALEAAEKALIKAEAGTERRLESLNELRAMATDQSNKLMPRAEYNAQHEALVERVQMTEQRLGTIEGRGGGLKDAWGYLVAIVMAAAAVAAYFHH